MIAPVWQLWAYSNNEQETRPLPRQKKPSVRKTDEVMSGFDLGIKPR